MAMLVVRVTFIGADGSVYEGEVQEGQSLMRAAQQLDVRGVIAECGGMCACSTCHCYVDAAWVDKLERRSDMEDGMLDAAWERGEHSRLTCQITVNRALNGIVLRVPAEQA